MLAGLACTGFNIAAAAGLDIGYTRYASALCTCQLIAVLVLCAVICAEYTVISGHIFRYGR